MNVKHETNGNPFNVFQHPFRDARCPDEHAADGNNYNIMARALEWVFNEGKLFQSNKNCEKVSIETLLPKDKIERIKILHYVAIGIIRDPKMTLKPIDEQIRQNSDQIILSTIKCVFHMGRTFRGLVEEEGLLLAENTLLINQIQQLKVVHQAEWTAMCENALTKVGAFAKKIQSLVRKVERFQEQEKDKLELFDKMGGEFTAVTRWHHKKLGYRETTVGECPVALREIDGEYEAVKQFRHSLKSLRKEIRKIRIDDNEKKHPSYFYEEEDYPEVAAKQIYEMLMPKQFLEMTQGYVKMIGKQDIIVSILRANRTNYQGCIEGMKRHHMEKVSGAKKRIYESCFENDIRYLKNLRNQWKKNNKKTIREISKEENLILSGYLKGGEMVIEELSKLIPEVKKLAKEYKHAGEK
jgi:hypothetical protein